MLVNTREMLETARNKGYAVGAFNTSDLAQSKAIVTAAEALRSPVILQTSEKAIDYAGLAELYAMLATIAKNSTVPVAIHLDHGKSYERAEECICIGYSSVMIDASRLDYRGNAALCRKVVRLAHPKRVTVEGELGVISGKEDYVKALESQLTDPDQAVDFVQHTGIDSLAVSIGNAHGVPSATEIFDSQRLAKIADKVKIPLVLHGASSTHPARIKQAISLGVAKINIDTDIRLAFSDDIRQFLDQHPDIYDPREYLGHAAKAIEKVVARKIMLFGSDQRA